MNFIEIVHMLEFQHLKQYKKYIKTVNKSPKLMVNKIARHQLC